ncbi:hypothetical protein M427DRAFT_138729 [Gonapodya prolifera JEL478]|uniref:SH3 domain-containing protein n=1 Tax=Gonapodya prolifera (strain JEL478) TaxID=1344416 RepID=A0A139A3I7_GONPJ|nr:hypothetical protein M427DRAFT_138729 [Gonapodya prolifera JEL478]|eukprot:KXS10943.1 hypothetical protein M427DRAFT_138729 [Gonapodya prolifera JEL478]
MARTAAPRGRQSGALGLGLRVALAVASVLALGSGARAQNSTTSGGCACTSTCYVSAVGGTVAWCWIQDTSCSPPFRDPVTGRAWDYCQGAALSSALASLSTAAAPAAGGASPTTTSAPTGVSPAPSPPSTTVTESPVSSSANGSAPAAGDDKIIGLPRTIFYAVIGGVGGVLVLILVCCCWWCTGRKKNKDPEGKETTKELLRRPPTSTSITSIPHLPDLDLGSGFGFGFLRSSSRQSRASSPGLFRSNSQRTAGTRSPTSPTPAQKAVSPPPQGFLGRLPSVGKGSKTWSPMTPSPLNPFGRRSTTKEPPAAAVAATTAPIATPIASQFGTLSKNPPPVQPGKSGHARGPSQTMSASTSFTHDARVAENPFSSDAASIVSAPSIRDASSPTPIPDGMSPEPDMDVEEWRPHGSEMEMANLLGGKPGPRETTPVPGGRSMSPVLMGNDGTFTVRGLGYKPRAGSPLAQNPYAMEPVRADSPSIPGWIPPRSPSTSDSYEGSIDSGLGPRSPTLAPIAAPGKTGIKVPLPKQPIPATVFHVTFHPPADGRLYAIEEYMPSDTMTSEIGLTPGDRLEVYEVISEGVLKGRNVDTGEVGVFPEWAVGRGQIGRGTPIGGLA